MTEAWIPEGELSCPGLASLGAPFDVDGICASEGEPANHRAGHFGIKPDVRQTVEQRIEGSLQFHARDVLTNADVSAIAERKITLLRPEDVELMGVRP